MIFCLELKIKLYKSNFEKTSNMSRGGFKLFNFFGLKSKAILLKILEYLVPESLGRIN